MRLLSPYHIHLPTVMDLGMAVGYLDTRRGQARLLH